MYPGSKSDKKAFSLLAFALPAEKNGLLSAELPILVILKDCTQKDGDHKKEN